ncbi:osmoprotectant ABC transporter substrate-binding protein [Cytobacillus horneckiae]|nr:osmoprotectant ABC transporter substrate-binding protein [Cytobacillus horneckiae]MEC1155902.1 osmoprotectant ABC transporter substrate-binding protein [Cytobacillus horneckiae]MED2939822.1 osmoprotectant ABC transporter substrate-binding protein [Cytobacillus horneckiae]
MKMKKNKFVISILIIFSIVLTGCSLPGLSGSDKNSISVGTISTSESQIVGQIIRQLIEEETDLTVEMVNNLGSSIVVHQAMVNGDVDISATRYTGTDLAGALKMEPVMDAEKAMEIVQTEFQKQFNQKWYDSYGFENSYAFTITAELAEKENIEKVSDLKSLAGDLAFGVDNSWLNRKGDGYEGFVEEYGFEFGNAFPMQIGLVYQAAASGDMDVVLAYTTDGRIKAFDLKVLEDDHNFFPPYETSAVASNDILEEHPEIDELLERLVGKIDTEMMQELNYEADGEMREPAIIAKEFLEENNYFRDEE